MGEIDYMIDLLQPKVIHYYNNSSQYDMCLILSCIILCGLLPFSRDCVSLRSLEKQSGNHTEALKLTLKLTWGELEDLIIKVSFRVSFCQDLRNWLPTSQFKRQSVSRACSSPVRYLLTNVEMVLHKCQMVCSSPLTRSAKIRSHKAK